MSRSNFYFFSKCVIGDDFYNTGENPKEVSDFLQLFFQGVRKKPSFSSLSDIHRNEDIFQFPEKERDEEHSSLKNKKNQNILSVTKDIQRQMRFFLAVLPLFENLKKYESKFQKRVSRGDQEYWYEKDEGWDNLSHISVQKFDEEDLLEISIEEKNDSNKSSENGIENFSKPSENQNENQGISLKYGLRKTSFERIQQIREKAKYHKIPMPSLWKEFGVTTSLAVGIFFLAFFGFNISSFITLSEKYWNAEEFTQTQYALANLTQSKPQALPVAGIENNTTTIPSLSLSIAPPDTRIIIPKLAKNIPIVDVPEDSLRAENWSQLEKDIQDGLRDGVVHYPGTANPGQPGNVFITGHSSYYPWDTGRYKDVFAALHDLEVGDEYFIYYKGVKHHYKIIERKVVNPKDVSVLNQPTQNKISTLMTCTPIGTTINRLILKAEEIE